MSGYIETFDNLDNNYLSHYGVNGMHWGHRKLINYGSTKGDKEFSKKLSTMKEKDFSSYMNKLNNNLSRATKDRKYRESPEYEQNVRNSIIFLSLLSGKKGYNPKTNAVTLDKDMIKKGEKMYSDAEKQLGDDYVETKSVERFNKGINKFNSDFDKRNNTTSNYNLNDNPALLKKYNKEAQKWMTDVGKQTVKDLGFEQSAFFGEYIEHFGIRGMHWGLRRYQNKDGSLTEKGKKKYGSYDKIVSDRKKYYEKEAKEAKKQIKYSDKEIKDTKKLWEKGMIDDPELYDYVVSGQYKKKAIKAYKESSNLSKNYSVEDAKKYVAESYNKEQKDKTDRIISSVGYVSAASLAGLYIYAKRHSNK